MKSSKRSPQSLKHDYNSNGNDSDCQYFTQRYFSTSFSSEFGKNDKKVENILKKYRKCKNQPLEEYIQNGEKEGKWVTANDNDPSFHRNSFPFNFNDIYHRDDLFSPSSSEHFFQPIDRFFSSFFDDFNPFSSSNHHIPHRNSPPHQCWKIDQKDFPIHPPSQKNSSSSWLPWIWGWGSSPSASQPSKSNRQQFPIFDPFTNGQNNINTHHNQDDYTYRIPSRPTDDHNKSKSESFFNSKSRGTPIDLSPLSKDIKQI